jgi:hypothetical protein
MKPFTAILVCLSILFASCTKSAILEPTPEPAVVDYKTAHNESIKQKNISASVPAINWDNKGYYASLRDTRNQEARENVYYNTTGFDLDWERIGNGVWKGTVLNDRIWDIKDITLRYHLDPHDNKKIATVEVSYERGEGFFIRAWDKKNKPVNEIYIDLDFDIWDYDTYYEDHE